MAYTKHGWHIKGTTLVDRPKELTPTKKCGGPGMCRDCSTDAAVPFKLEVNGTWEVDPGDFVVREPISNPLNDPIAMTKVYDILKSVGLSGTQIVAAFNDMDKAGVVFRLERG